MVVNTKYSVGEDVWIIHSNKAKKFEVNGVFVEVHKDEPYITYILKGLGDWKYNECELYPSKEELLESL